MQTQPSTSTSDGSSSSNTNKSNILEKQHHSGAMRTPTLEEKLTSFYLTYNPDKLALGISDILKWYSDDVESGNKGETKGKIVDLNSNLRKEYGTDLEHAECVPRFVPVGCECEPGYKLAGSKMKTVSLNYKWYCYVTSITINNSSNNSSKASLSAHASKIGSLFGSSSGCTTTSESIGTRSTNCLGDTQLLHQCFGPATFHFYYNTETGICVADRPDDFDTRQLDEEIPKELKAVMLRAASKGVYAAHGKSSSNRGSSSATTGPESESESAASRNDPTYIQRAKASDVIGKVLRSIGEGFHEQYHNLFVEEEIEIGQLRLLTSADLKELGVKKMGPRKKMMVAFSQVSLQQTQRPNLNERQGFEVSGEVDGVGMESTSEPESAGQWGTATGKWVEDQGTDSQSGNDQSTASSADQTTLLCIYPNVTTLGGTSGSIRGRGASNNTVGPGFGHGPTMLQESESTLALTLKSALENETGAEGTLPAVPVAPEPPLSSYSVLEPTERPLGTTNEQKQRSPPVESVLLQTQTQTQTQTQAQPACDALRAVGSFCF
jgi:hypothetical protein